MIALAALMRNPNDIECVKSVVEDSVLEIAKQGGSSYGNTIRYNGYDVVLYADGDIESVPSIDDIQRAINELANERVAECGDKKVDVRIIGQNVLVSATSQILLGIDIAGCYEKAYKLYENQKRDVVSLVDLARMAKEGGYVLDVHISNDSVIYILSFNDMFVKGKQLTYAFGIRKTQKG